MKLYLKNIADINRYIAFISSFFKVFIFIILFSGISPDSFPQTREYLLKAGFIEKFTHFIEWPASKTADANTNFIVSVIGENNYDNALEKIFNQARIMNKQVRVRFISSLNDIEGSSILIISESKQNKLDDILSYTNNRPILTISDINGYGKKGVMINMFIDNNHLRYEINRTAVDKSGLKISSLLLNSAVIVKSYE